MPRFKVVEKRAYKEGFLIDAVDEEAAKRLDGEVVADASTDSWADELLELEQVADDEEDIEL